MPPGPEGQKGVGRAILTALSGVRVTEAWSEVSFHDLMAQITEKKAIAA